MLGIIIEAHTNTTDFPNKIFYRFGNKTVLERIVDSCVQSPFAHKVILAMPSSDKSAINGSVFHSVAVNISNASHFDRGAIPFFYGRVEDRLERLHRCALAHGLDDIVLIQAENFLIPTWLINELIDYYMRIDKKPSSTNPKFIKGLEMQALPFHMLAVALINNNIEILDTTYTSRSMDSLSNLTSTNDTQSLRISSLDKIETLTKAVAEIDLGADLADVVQDIRDGDI